MVIKAKALVKRFVADERGASLLEYSILIGIITALVVGTIGFVGDWVGGQWIALNNSLTGEGAPPTQ